MGGGATPTASDFSGAATGAQAAQVGSSSANTSSALAGLQALGAAAGVAAEIAKASKITPGVGISNNFGQGSVPVGDPKRALGMAGDLKIPGGKYNDNSQMYVPSQPLQMPDLLATLMQMSGGKR